MNKKELIAAAAGKAELSRKDTEKILEALEEVIADSCETMLQDSKAVQELAQAANLYIEEKAPFRLAKDENAADQLAVVMYNLLESIRVCALYLAPFAPNTSAEAFRRLGLGDLVDVTDIESASAWGQLPAGNAVEVGNPLFPRLDVDEIDFDVE